MITTIISDFSRVILDTKDKSYRGTLNGLHREMTQKFGNYNFFEYFEFNTELLDFYNTLKAKYSINIFTAGVIQKEPVVQKVISPIFDNIFSAQELHTEKSDTDAYKLILDTLKCKAEETIFIDDQEENLLAAGQTGIQTIKFKSNIQLKTQLPLMLI